MSFAEFGRVVTPVSTPVLTVLGDPVLENTAGCNSNRVYVQCIYAIVMPATGG